MNPENYNDIVALEKRFYNRNIFENDVDFILRTADKLESSSPNAVTTPEKKFDEFRRIIINLKHLISREDIAGIRSLYNKAIYGDDSELEKFLIKFCANFQGEKEVIASYVELKDFIYRNRYANFPIFIEVLSRKVQLQKGDEMYSLFVRTIQLLHQCNPRNQLSKEIIEVTRYRISNYLDDIQETKPEYIELVSIFRTVLYAQKLDLKNANNSLKKTTPEFKKTGLYNIFRGLIMEKFESKINKIFDGLNDLEPSKVTFEIILQLAYSEIHNDENLKKEISDISAASLAKLTGNEASCKLILFALYSGYLGVYTIPNKESFDNIIGILSSVGNYSDEYLDYAWVCKAACNSLYDKEYLCWGYANLIDSSDDFKKSALYKTLIKKQIERICIYLIEGAGYIDKGITYQSDQYNDRLIKPIVEFNLCFSSLKYKLKRNETTERILPDIALALVRMLEIEPLFLLYINNVLKSLGNEELVLSILNEASKQTTNEKILKFINLYKMVSNNNTPPAKTKSVMNIEIVNEVFKNRNMSLSDEVLILNFADRVGSIDLKPQTNDEIKFNQLRIKLAKIKVLIEKNDIDGIRALYMKEDQVIYGEASEFEKFLINFCNNYKLTKEIKKEKKILVKDEWEVALDEENIDTIISLLKSGSYPTLLEQHNKLTQILKKVSHEKLAELLEYFTKSDKKNSIVSEVIRTILYPLHHGIIFASNKNDVRDLLRQYPDSANTLDDLGRNILHLALLNVDPQVLNFILAKRIVDINKTSTNLERTAFDIALVEKKWPQAEALLDFGARYDDHRTILLIEDLKAKYPLEVKPIETKIVLLETEKARAAKDSVASNAHRIITISSDSKIEDRHSSYGYSRASNNSGNSQKELKTKEVKASKVSKAKSEKHVRKPSSTRVVSHVTQNNNLVANTENNNSTIRIVTPAPFDRNAQIARQIQADKEELAEKQKKQAAKKRAESARYENQSFADAREIVAKYVKQKLEEIQIKLQADNVNLSKDFLEQQQRPALDKILVENKRLLKTIKIDENSSKLLLLTAAFICAYSARYLSGKNRNLEHVYDIGNALAHNQYDVANGNFASILMIEKLQTIIECTRLVNDSINVGSLRDEEILKKYPNHEYCRVGEKNNEKRREEYIKDIYYYIDLYNTQKDALPDEFKAIAAKAVLSAIGEAICQFTTRPKKEELRSWFDLAANFRNAALHNDEEALKALDADRILNGICSKEVLDYLGNMSKPTDLLTGSISASNNNIGNTK